MKDKERVIDELKKLYKQNLSFIESIENGTSKRKFTDKTISQFKKLNIQLNEYIHELEDGLDGNQNEKDWCNFFANVLMNDCLLDDDNFPIGWDW